MPANKTAGTCHQDRGGQLGRELREPNPLRFVSRSGGALRPIDDLPGIGEADEGLQLLVKLGDEHLQPVIRHDLAAQEPDNVTGHLRANGAAFAESVAGAFDGFGERSILAMGNEHRKEIDPQCAFRALDEKLILNRPHVPRELNLPGTLGAPDERAPFVEEKIGIGLVKFNHRGHRATERPSGLWTGNVSLRICDYFVSPW